MVERELRSSARQTFTYYLRVIGAALMLFAAALFGLKSGFVHSLGGQLFGALHVTLFAAIWVFVPFLTADCISRERREGTLGLLFLTRLGAGDIVLAKSFAHGLRAATLWLAVLPVLAIPFLLGGVGWREAFLSVCVNLSSMFLALAAGLLGSSASRVWARILVWVVCLSLLLCVLFALVHCLVVLHALGSGYLRRVLTEPLVRLVGIAFILITDSEGTWSTAARLSPAQNLHWLEGAGLATIGSAAFLWLAVWLAARRVRYVWREEPAGCRIQWLMNKFCRPVFFRTLLRRWMQRKLRLNPVGWLEQRSWSGRMVGWLWLGLVMLFACPGLVIPEALGDSGQVAHAMVAILGLGLSLSAAASFRRERETGVLELLLVSPLGEGRIVSGRVRGLWMQFLPGAALLIAIWLFAYHLGFSYQLWSTDHSELEVIAFSASTFITLPVIGLYFSLRFRGFPLALLATIATGFAVPMLMAGFENGLWRLYVRSTAYYSWDVIFPSFDAIAWQFVLGALAWHALHRRLKTRAFLLSS